MSNDITYDEMSSQRGTARRNNYFEKSRNSFTVAFDSSRLRLILYEMKIEFSCEHIARL